MCLLLQQERKRRLAVKNNVAVAKSQVEQSVGRWGVGFWFTAVRRKHLPILSELLAGENVAYCLPAHEPLQGRLSGRSLFLLVVVVSSLRRVWRQIRAPRTLVWKQASLDRAKHVRAGNRVFPRARRVPTRDHEPGAKERQLPRSFSKNVTWFVVVVCGWTLFFHEDFVLRSRRLRSFVCPNRWQPALEQVLCLKTNTDPRPRFFWRRRRAKKCLFEARPRNPGRNRGFNSAGTRHTSFAQTMKPSNRPPPAHENTGLRNPEDAAAVKTSSGKRPVRLVDEKSALHLALMSIRMLKFHEGATRGHYGWCSSAESPLLALEFRAGQFSCARYWPVWKHSPEVQSAASSKNSPKNLVDHILAGKAAPCSVSFSGTDSERACAACSVLAAFMQVQPASIAHVDFETPRDSSLDPSAVPEAPPPEAPQLQPRGMGRVAVLVFKTHQSNVDKKALEPVAKSAATNESYSAGPGEATPVTGLAMSAVSVYAVLETTNQRTANGQSHGKEQFFMTLSGEEALTEPEQSVYEEIARSQPMSEWRESVYQKASMQLNPEIGTF